LSAGELHNGPIHLLLTDVVMPGMTGQQLAAQLSPAHPEMKILYMSGYTADVLSREVVAASGGGYIEKPFSPEALAREVRTLLGKSKAARKVIVVDDDPGIREFFASVLRFGGYGAEVACDGVEAQARIEEGEFDLAIVDMNLPDNGCAETIRSIRTRRPGVKIIVASGAFTETSRQAAAACGADAALSKPVSPDRLLETVRGTLC
jgi:DNA-binding response OmpR family regulator